MAAAPLSAVSMSRTLLLFFVLVCLLSPVRGDTLAGGGLVMVMTCKNEADNLRRGLPEWAKVLDAWVIGLDHANTDDSEAIIKQYLGHIPGKLETVVWDGVGPTITRLMKVAAEAFPQYSHAILADADYVPLVKTFDKTRLHPDCGLHQFQVNHLDNGASKQVGWIWRNLPGAVMSRRYHVICHPPPGMPRFCPRLSSGFVIEERMGGYQDRSGKKIQTQIMLLEKDLADIPDDPHTVYYLGEAHFHAFEASKHTDMASLREAMRYMTRRAYDMPDARDWEQTYFALLKVGEISERWLGDSEAAVKAYLHATQWDPERGDAWFYLAQHHRTSNRLREAANALWPALGLQAKPPRDWHNWDDYYDCIIPLEFANIVNGIHPRGGVIGLAAIDCCEKALRLCEGKEELDLARKLLPRLKEQVVNKDNRGAWRANDGIPRMLPNSLPTGRGDVQRVTPEEIGAMAGVRLQPSPAEGRDDGRRQHEEKFEEEEGECGLQPPA